MAILTTILWVIITILLIITLLFIINETNFMYSEPQQYVEYNTHTYKLLHEECAPQYHINGNKQAIMFVHGFSGSAKEFYYYTQITKDKNFDVITPLLPSSGRSKELFKKTYFTQWYNYLKDQYLKYRKNYNEFYIVGLSMGGSMTLKIAEEFSNDINLSPTAIITAATPVFINSLFENGVLHNPFIYLTRIASWFTSEIPKKKSKTPLDGWDRSITYTGIFPKQLHSVKMGLKPIKKNLHKISVPILIAHAKKDTTAPFENAGYIAKKVSSKKISMRMYDLSEFNHSHHTLTVFDSTRDDLYEEIMHFINKVKSSQ